jgi:adenosine 3'-phospho 5'-phosphosulfate transporter B2
VLADYLIAVGVMAGCTIFAMYGPTTSKKAKKGAAETGMYGVALMLGYLGFDGFTSTFQDKLFKGYQMETYNQMLWVNFCSALISSFWLLSDASMGAAIDFIKTHPESMYDVLILSVASTCGQLCILYTIREFGALLFATIMTTRQFLSILLSCILFMHPLTWQQWCGTGMVFSALYYQAFLKVGRRGRGEGENPYPTMTVVGCLKERLIVFCVRPNPGNPKPAVVL